MVRCLLIISLIFEGCNLSSPSIPYFDSELWKKDVFGCQGLRNVHMGQLYEYKELLLGYNQNEIKYYLGKPDEQELFNRSQTFFHYYIAGHSSCGDSTASSNPISLQIRFNALNSSNEVFFKNFDLIKE